MFKIFKRFFLSILNIQILNIVSSEPKEWTIHFDKFHYQNYFRKTHDPIFPLKKKNKIKKKKQFEKGRKVPGLLKKQIKRPFKILVSNHMIS